MALMAGSLTDEEATVGEEGHRHGLLNVHKFLLDEPRRHGSLHGSSQEAQGCQRHQEAVCPCTRHHAGCVATAEIGRKWRCYDARRGRK